jgi:outer membrane protein assembly factor BamB
MSSVATEQMAMVEVSTNTSPPVRVWPPVLMAVLFWIFWVAHYVIPMDAGTRFLSRLGASALLLLGFLIWWLSRRAIRWQDRLLAVALWIVATFAAVKVADKSLGDLFSMLLSTATLVVTAWTIWVWASRNLSLAVQRVGFCLVLLLTLGYFTLVRFDGLEANQFPRFSWRWSQTAEQVFLAQQGQADVGGAAAIGAKDWSLRPNDWPEFRGPSRDGIVTGVKIATNWTQNPPKELWRHRVGPGWSSMIVVDGHLVTQEQRDQSEVVVCYDAATGKEEWSHGDKSRFEETLAGAGPRGTPTFHNGRVYALGGKGVLNCLQAATGDVVWSHDVVADTKASVPQWGYSVSPLISDGMVIVFAAGTEEGKMLAYRADSGEQAWERPCGPQTYSSPEQITVGGRSQVLIHDNHSLAAVNPADGKTLWTRAETSAMALPMLQPTLVSDHELLVATDPGMVLLDMKQAGDKWTATDLWTSSRLKPAFNDVIVHDGHVFGLDDGILCCLDLATGERLWKKGRYGGGQLLLLADQGDLLVLTEKGEVVLVPATAEKPDERGRFQSIEGKTWNHPVVAEGRLFVRNGEEMACYQLQPATPAVAARPSVQPRDLLLAAGPATR